MKKRLLAFLLAAGMVVGQALPAYAANGNGVQQGELVQTESEAQLLNADETISETRYMYLQDYPTVWYYLKGINWWNEDVTITVADESVCQYMAISSEYNMKCAQFKALKTGKTTIHISWEEDGKKYQKTFEVIVKNNMPSDGVRITDAAILDTVLKESRPDDENKSLSDDGYISEDELQMIDSLYASNVEKLDDLKYFSNLKTLRLSGTFSDVSGLGNLHKLENLTICSSGQKIDVSCLSQLSALKNLSFSRCENLNDVSGIYNLASQLDSIDFSYTKVPTDQRAEFLKGKLQHMTVGDKIFLGKYAFSNISFQQESELVKLDTGLNSMTAQRAGSGSVILNLDGVTYEMPIKIQGVSEEDSQIGEEVDYTVKAVLDITQNDKSLILTSTGDLWQTAPEVKKEKSNVKKYVGDWVYSGSDRIKKQFVLSMNNVLSSDGADLAYDVKDFSGHYALTNQDVLLDIYNTDEKTIDNVADWVERNGNNTYVLKKDGTVWGRKEVAKDTATNSFEQIASNVKKISRYGYLTNDYKAYYYEGSEMSSPYDGWDADKDEYYYDADGNCIAGSTLQCNLGKIKVKAVYNDSYGAIVYYLTEDGELYRWEKERYSSSQQPISVTKISSDVTEIVSDWRTNDCYGFNVLVTKTDGKYYTYDESSKVLESRTWMDNLNLDTLEWYLLRNDVPVLDHIMHIEKADTFVSGYYLSNGEDAIIRTDGTIWELQDGIPVKIGRLDSDTPSTDDNRHPDGLSDIGENGNWYYYKDGKIATDVTTVAENASGWWYVKNGQVDFNYTGLAQNESGWWRIVNGAVDFNCTSVVNSEYGWWYVRNGQIIFDYTGLAPNENGWWRIVNGAVDFNCTSVVNSEYGWWFVRNGQIDFAYTGLASNENGWWRIVNGTVDFNCTSVVNSEYGWWYVKNGQIDFTYTGVASNEYGWWRIENGALNFGFTGLAQNEYGWWYIRNGQLDFSYSGYVNWYGVAYRVQSGQVIF